MGTALRCAQALGLHVRNEDPKATAAEQELLSRVWWALYIFEENLSMIVGRPILVSDGYCSTALPLPLSVEQLSDATVISQFDMAYKAASIHQITFRARSAALEPPNSGSYLMALVHISTIAQRAVAKLYSTKTMEQSWEQTQKNIAGLSNQLEEWSSSLPSGFRFTQAPTDTRFRLERFTLEMHYCRVKILITRPCLGRLDHPIAGQTKTSDDFDMGMAGTCVNAAKAVANMLPDHIDTVHLYSDGPWWSVVHHFVEAITVLLVEMSHSSVQRSEYADNISPQLKKLRRWLRALKKSNEVAERGYSTTSEILQRVGHQIGVDVSDLFGEDTVSGVGSLALSPEAQFPASWSMQQNPYPAQANGQQYEGQAMNENGYVDGQIGYGSMPGL